MPREPGTRTATFNLHLTTEIAKWAEIEHRTFNNMAEQIIRDGLRAREKEAKAKAATS
ncbi:MAG TPA: hypothetical protein VM487_15645 [Phycisphaerae bacterium]|nr:hypothetical protein [Phycisphaerae bacterium]